MSNHKKKWNRKHLLSRLLRDLIIIVAIVWVGFPLYWMVITALKDEVSMLHYPPFFWPPKVMLGNIPSLILGTSEAGSIVNPVKDSLIIALSNTVVTLTVAIPAAYSIARFKTGGKNLSLWILSNRLLPPIAIVIPLFVIYQAFGLLNNYLGLVWAYMGFNVPFAVWLLIGFIKNLSPEIEESALVDGCGGLQVFRRIVIPLIAPGVVVTALFIFIFAWSEYMFALLVTGPKIRTLPVYLPTLRGTHILYYHLLCGAAIISVIPGMVLVFLLCKYLVGGLTFGAVK